MAELRRWNDDETRTVYLVLIDASWEDADHFDALQGAWRYLAQAQGVERIEDNGHGRVLRLSGRG